MPTMTGALVAVRHGQRPNTNRAWQPFTHTRILGEHTANINSSGNYPLTVCIERGETEGWVQQFTDIELPCQDDPVPKVPSNWLQCVFFLYDCKADAEKSIAESGGTGFLIAVPLPSHPEIHYSYAVTNWHLIEGNQRPTLRLNKKDGGVGFIETKADSWIVDKAEDIAMRAMGEDFTEYEHSRILTEELFFTKPEDSDVGAGDEVALVGRFTKEDGKTQNTPVLRFGNVARVPTSEHDWYLVEMRSISGHSGSPVFFMGAYMQLAGIRPNAPKMKLLGMDRGHIPDVEPIFSRKKPTEQYSLVPGWIARSHTAMARVIPSWKLHAMLGREEIVKKIKQVDEAMTANRKQFEFVQDTASATEPTPQLIQSQTTDQGYEIPVPTKEKFLGDLGKASRKIEPKSKA
jgi:hypothetical protein